jgi:hypothetical protein
LKYREVLEGPKIHTKIQRDAIIKLDDDEPSSDEDNRSPTSNSIGRTKRPPRRKQVKEKGNKARDDDFTKLLDAIFNGRKEMPEERNIARIKEVAEARVTEERSAATEERLAAVEERKVAMEEAHRLIEHEKNLFMMDKLKPTSMRIKRITPTFAVMKCWQKKG